MQEQVTAEVTANVVVRPKEHMAGISSQSVSYQKKVWLVWCQPGLLLVSYYNLTFSLCPFHISVAGTVLIMGSHYQFQIINLYRKYGKYELDLRVLPTPTFPPVCAVDSQVGNPTGSALVTTTKLVEFVTLPGRFFTSFFAARSTQT